MKNKTGKFLLVLGTLTLVGLVPLFSHQLLNEMPKEKSVKTGNVYRYDSHGEVVFLDKRGGLKLWGSCVLGVTCVIAGAVILNHKSRN